MKQLHTGAKWLFRINSYFIMLFLVFFFGWLFFAISFSLNSNHNLIFYFIIFYIILIFVIGEIYARMAYNRWFYEFSDTNLKLERGIIWKRYSNVPYERIQNVDITRGILARIFGFSSVMIQTAGYSYQRKGFATEGYIPAVSVDEAEKIREFVMKKIQKNKGRQGL